MLLSKSKRLERRFAKIAEKHNLKDKVTIHLFQDGKKLIWTVYPIISKEENRFTSIDHDFIQEIFNKVVIKAKTDWLSTQGRDAQFEFRTSSTGKTIEEINNNINSWNSHCALMDLTGM